MKKIVVLFLVLCFIIGMYAEAFAEVSEVKDLRSDLMAIDLDILIAYRDLINEIIAEKGGEGNTTIPETQIPDGEDFAAGVYEVGKNIKAGTYVLSFYELDSSGAIVSIFNSRADRDAGEYRERFVATESYASYTITLEDKNVLDILMVGSGKIKISVPEASWLP